MGSNPGYLLKSFLLYPKIVFWKKTQKACPKHVMFFLKCYLLKPNFIFCWKLQNLLDCRPQDDPETRRELLEATSWAKKYLIFSWSAKIYDLSEQISKEFVHFILFFRFLQHNALSGTPWYIACKSDPAELPKSWFSVKNITEKFRSCQLDLGRF